MKVRFIGALLLLVLSCEVASASDKPNPAVNANDKDSFQVVSEWVRKQMEAGGRYVAFNLGATAILDRDGGSLGVTAGVPLGLLRR